MENSYFVVGTGGQLWACGIQYYQATSYFYYMNTSVLPCLPSRPSEQSRPPPSSRLINDHPKIPHTLLRVLLVALLVRGGRADDRCYTITSSYSQSNCQICQTSLGMTCRYTVSNRAVRSLAPGDCSKTCCNANQFDNTNQYSLCASQGTFSQSGGNNSQLSLATILIIIFFSIPAGICLLIVICSCINGRQRTEQAGGEQPYLSAVNLNDFNLQDLGPLYQDRSQNCSICLQGDCNLRTRCGHSYHSQCLCAWIHKKQKCPLCVTRDFNPIILYCGQCFKQGRLVQLMDRMREEEELEWRGYVEWKCGICLGNGGDDVISLEFSLSEEKGKEGVPSEGYKSASKAKVNEE